MPKKKREIKEGQQAQAVIPGFKGFDKDMQCRGFQFKQDETYHHAGQAKACNSGFHYCENPLDVFRYYHPGKGSKFYAVNGAGQFDRHTDDSKVTCTELSIQAEVTLSEMIKLGVKYVWKKATDTTKPTSGNSSSAATSGNSSSAATSGDYSSAATSGDCSPAVCAGLNSKAKAGRYGCIALAWWNKAEDRAEMRCEETGCGDGSDGKLKAGVWYKLNDKAEFVEVQ